MFRDAQTTYHSKPLEVSSSHPAHQYALDCTANCRVISMLRCLLGVQRQDALSVETLAASEVTTLRQSLLGWNLTGYTQFEPGQKISYCYS